MEFFKQDNFFAGTVAVLLASVLAAATIGALGSRHSVAQAAPTAQVHYADLDLSHPAGVTTLRKRIHLAATQVCGPRDPQSPAAQSRCVQDATDRALAQVGLKD
jgi:UrcA family protein